MHDNYLIFQLFTPLFGSLKCQSQSKHERRDIYIYIFIYLFIYLLGQVQGFRLTQHWFEYFIQ
jgi:hypothetical protein